MRSTPRQGPRRERQRQALYHCRQAVRVAVAATGHLEALARQAVGADASTRMETGHSRYPIVEREGDLDHLVGVLYTKDLVRVAGDPEPAEILEMLREPLYIPESATVMEALHLLRQKRSGFAAVLDEHGGVEGILTIKDLVSELVGEIQDEFDPGVPITILTVSGDIPREGDSIVIAGLRFTVLHMEGRRIDRIRVQPA